MDSMLGNGSAAAGWQVDEETLREVVTDEATVLAALQTGSRLDRLFYLRLLDRLDEAMAEAQAVFNDPLLSADPWRPLMLTADVLRWQNLRDAAEEIQLRAWPHALTRERQASTLHAMGNRLYEYGDLDATASYFCLARTMREGFAPKDQLARTETALRRVREDLNYDAIVLAGGAGQRLGRPSKPETKLAGWPLLDHVLLAVAGATNRIVVGPTRRGLAAPTFCQEEPAGAGPVAAIAAALPAVQADVVVLLAADLPFVGPALDQLRVPARLLGKDAAVLVDRTGRVNYLASAWRRSSLEAALRRVGNPANAPLRMLYESADLVHQPDFDALGADCDTEADLADAEERIKSQPKNHSSAQPPATPLSWRGLELYSPS